MKQSVVGTRGHDPIDWTPEPTLISIKSDGIVPHPDPANPNTPIFVATEIPEVLFFRYAMYYPHETHGRDFIDNMYRYVLDSIHLVSDGKDDEIYCFAFSGTFGFPLLFGKLHQECQVYHKCMIGFAGMLE
jgi:hypothetical protein